MKKWKLLLALRQSELKKTLSWATVDPVVKTSITTNLAMKVLGQVRQWVGGLIHRRTITQVMLANVFGL